MNLTRPFKDIPASVRRMITDNRLLRSGETILAAVSGGADSVALLHMLNRIGPEFGVGLAVAHVDHGLRGMESDEDRFFVERLSERLGLRCHSIKTDVLEFSRKNRLSLEEAGREARYRFLFDTSESMGYEKIATAHHEDDCTELFFMNLFRGSGPSGLKTMGASGFNGRVIRPLIGMRRKEILSYIEENKLNYRNDSSNADRSFLRNRIRLDLIPLLEENYNGGIKGIVARTASIIRKDEDFLNQVIAPLFREAVAEEKENSVSLSVSKLTGHHPAALSRIIRKAIFRVKKNLRRISSLHTDLAADLLSGDGNLRSIDLPDRLRVIRNGNLLIFRIEDGPLRTTPVSVGKT